MTAQPDARTALAQRRENGNVATNTIADQIRGMEKHYQLAMPKGAEAAQLVRDALTALRTTKHLEKCEAQSVLGSLMTCAQLGLRPGVLGQAWLLPFWTSKLSQDGEGKWRGGYKAQLVIGYQGLIELAHRSGQIASLSARTVFENDEFQVQYGVADNLIHNPLMTGEDRGKPIAYYAVVKYTNGGYSFFVMSHVEMEKYRDKHATAKTREGKVFGPWVDHFEGQAHKGLALDTPIPTATGWSTNGELQVGDRLFDMYGQPTTIRAVSEIKHLDCYRVTFANGSSIVCDSEHIWVAGIGENAARDRAAGWASYEITDLYAAKNAGRPVVMPIAGALAADPADLLVDPWMLGLWLGDGAKANATISCHTDQVDDIKVGIEAAGYTVGTVRPDKRSKSCAVGVRGGLAKDLAKLGVLGHKHIPDQYFRGSIDQRLALLRGLIDSDGSIDARRGRVRFVNTDIGLAKGVAELARSLGELVHWGERDAVGFGKTVKAYVVCWTPTVCPATLPAKVARFRGHPQVPSRTVKSIELIDSVPTRCIAVDSPTRTYLAGVEMVPTHNTCFRQLSKVMPKSTELQQALAADEGFRVDLTPTTDATEATQHIDPDVLDGEVVDGGDTSQKGDDPWAGIDVAQVPADPKKDDDKPGSTS